MASDPENIIPGDAVRTVVAFRGSANRPVVVPEEVAIDAEIVYRCHVKKLSGKTWADIAREEGFPTSASCREQVTRYLAEARAMVEAHTAKQMLVNEVMLLDYLQTRLWPDVEAGDRQAIETVVKIADKRVTWQNLAIADAAKPTEVHTIIVPGEEMTQYLKNAAKQAEIAASEGHESGQTVPSTVSEPQEES